MFSHLCGFSYSIIMIIMLYLWFFYLILYGLIGIRLIVTFIKKVRHLILEMKKDKDEEKYKDKEKYKFCKYRCGCKKCYWEKFKRKIVRRRRRVNRRDRSYIRIGYYKMKDTIKKWISIPFNKGDKNKWNERRE